MRAKFDLLEEPWIPVRMLTGERCRVGLRRLLREAHRIGDVEVPVPPAASGLLRILYVLAFRVAAIAEDRLADPDVAENGPEWLSVRGGLLGWEGLPPDAIEEYVSAFSGRFDLFDAERPFLQDPRLAAECTTSSGEPNPSGVNKLVMGRPTGVNGAVLFGHFSDTAPVAVPAAEAAWHLIAQLGFGPSGQCTPRRITNVKPGNGDAGPLRKTVSFHPWGPNLFTTLVLGMPRWRDGLDLDMPDQCPWEREALPDPLASPLHPVTWPGGLLTGRARHAVFLVPSSDGSEVVDAYVTWATHAAAPFAIDPYVVRDHNRKTREVFARPADQDRAVWRDVDALLLKEQRGGERPVIFDDLGLLPPERAERLRVRAYGFEQDGQQKDFGWYAATTPPVLQYLEEQDGLMAARFSVCRAAAEDLGHALRFAAKAAWSDIGGTNGPKNEGPWASPAAAAYWSAAERIFWELVRPEAASLPHPRFYTAAEASLKDAMGRARSDIRGARAFRHAVGILRKAVPPSPPAAPNQAA